VAGGSAKRSGTSRRRGGKALMGICNAAERSLIGVTTCPPIWMVMAELYFAMFAVSGFVIVRWPMRTDVYSTAHSGFIGGSRSGLVGRSGSAHMPIFGRLFDHHDYQNVVPDRSAIPRSGLFWLAVAQLAAAA